MYVSFFFFNDTATTEIYTLSLHDALPISARALGEARKAGEPALEASALLAFFLLSMEVGDLPGARESLERSEEHTSELQSRQYLVCRLLLEKKKKPIIYIVPNDDCILVTY